jgi:hypothetical protein
MSKHVELKADERYTAFRLALLSQYEKSDPKSLNAMLLYLSSSAGSPSSLAVLAIHLRERMAGQIKEPMPASYVEALEAAIVSVLTLFNVDTPLNASDCL